MFGKMSKRKFSLELYDKVLNDVEELHRLTVPHMTLHTEAVLDRDEFVEITFLFLYGLYRDILINKYNAKDIFTVIKTGVEILSRKSIHGFEQYWSLYCEIMQKIILTGDTAVSHDQNPYEGLAALYIGYIYNSKVLEEKAKISKAYEQDFNELFYELSDYFGDFFVRNKYIGW
jgi:hypothetical protein